MRARRQIRLHLSLRSAQGFLESVIDLMGVELPVPDYTTVCRRQAGLALRLQIGPATAPRHVVIDTTGLRVFGAGEWTVRKHGIGCRRRRVWRKLHLGVDETSKEIVAADLTNCRLHDGVRLRSILDQVTDRIGQVSADTVYDIGRCYEAITDRAARPTIPPRRRARVSVAKNPPAFRAERDAVVRRIRDAGRYVWRTTSGATRPSLAENAISRFKALIGVRLAA